MFNPEDEDYDEIVQNAHREWNTNRSSNAVYYIRATHPVHRIQEEVPTLKGAEDITRLNSNKVQLEAEGETLVDSHQDHIAEGG